MAEIAFHFNAPDKVAYACRLLRKAVVSGAKVFVVVPAAQIDHLDESLWTFSQLEFLAHCRMDSPQALRQASLHSFPTRRLPISDRKSVV